MTERIAETEIFLGITNGCTDWRNDLIDISHFENVHFVTETAAADETWKMASRWKLGMGFVKLESGQCGEESSESENESDTVKPFARKLSINRGTKSSDIIKEGFLLKQTSFQRWRRRYFRLRGRKLYYAKDAKALLFDEIELSSVSFGGIGTKNGNNSFQIITPFRRLVLAAETKREMEEWMTALTTASSKDYCDINSEIQGNEHEEFLSGHHHWYATSHARPTYCNVCREPLSGVTSHGLSCEICKCKVHKRCAVKAIPNCKWTTLASIGHDIIEDQFGNITMPHQWMEGNLPVSSKCSVCDKTCGSVLRLQDWRCLWCRASVHTACRPNYPVRCPLGPAKVSVVPPTALHSIGNDEAWEAVRPQGCSPLLVFVNSKSGENQGIKFLRRFKQLLNPAQVFDLIHGGPTLGLRLFRNFDPFRILVCSGDGSVGWVLSEVDRLNMHKQCQIGVLPLGTGNDLARVLGWGASCDDETHLPQLLDKYEKASTKMLDRWSVMTLEKGMLLPRAGSRLSLDDPLLTSAMAECEDSVMSHLAKIIQSDQHSVVISSAKILCETVKDFTLRVAQTTLAQGDLHFSDKCQLLNNKLDLLVQILEKEGGYTCKEDTRESEDAIVGGEEEKMVAEKREKDIINLKKTGKAFVGRDALMSRANSLKKAVRQLVEYMEGAIDQQNTHGLAGFPHCEHPYACRRGSKHSLGVSDLARTADGSKVPLTTAAVADAEATPRSSPRPSVADVENQKMFLLPSPLPSRHSSRAPSAADIRISALSPMPDMRRESACDEMITLPVPDEFADNLVRRKSFPLDGDKKRSAVREECPKEENMKNLPFSLNVEVDKGGGTHCEKDLIDFEKDVMCGLERSEGPSLWETVLSSLNEDTRSVVSESRASSRRSSRMDAPEENPAGAHLKCDTSFNASDNSLLDGLPGKLTEIVVEAGNENEADNDGNSGDNHRGGVEPFDGEGTTFSPNFNNRIEEMDLSHIDSSESPSEETSPPNRISSPPPEPDPEEPPKIPECPRYIHKSQTENLLGVPGSGSNVTRSWTDLPKEEDRGLDAFEKNLLKVSIREGNEITYPGFCGEERKRTIFRRYSDVKTSKDLSNEMSLKQENLKRGRKSLDLYEHPFLCRKDSRKLYMDNDIDITDDIELEPELRCSLAQFVEGNDIARMSFRKKARKKTSANDAEMDMVKIQFKGSNGDLTKEWNEKFNAQTSKMDRPLGATNSETDDEELVEHSFATKEKVRIKEVPEFQFVVDPPSPSRVTPPEFRSLISENVGKLSAVSSLPGGGLLHASPQATRRISNCSLMKAEIMEAFAEARNRSRSMDKGDMADFVKKLPIINPLVRLPSWPNVSGGAGLISKVLLANADALCATAAPLMDFDETLLEGFYEKCVMNNYFGIGIDAKIALDFHHKREEHPEKCRSRAKNYMWYGVLGSREWLQKTYKNLEQRVQLECDGQRIPLPSLQGIVVLNIPSFMGGTNFWGGTKEDDCFLAPSFDDRILEVVAVFGSVQMAASRLINLQHHRIAQCQSVQINILGDEGVPIQVDGEAWVQPPGVIRIIHKNRMQMLCRNRALETCLKSWEEKQRLCQSQPPHSLSQTPQSSTATNQSSSSVSDSAFPELLTEEESRLLLGFIEVTSTLVKCVQLATISHPCLDKELYDLASRTSCSLESVHPRGKIIEGPELRPKVTNLVASAKDLYEEACSLLREKSQIARLREDTENKLTGALADMEMELRKCSLDENGLVGFHHIFEQSGTNKGRGRGLFWLKLRRHGNQRQREAAAWGVADVSQWLESLQLSEYIESFAKNDIRGKELLALARRDLKELGVTKVGHVKRILQAIRDLNT